MLLEHGRVLERALRSEAFSEDELHSAARERGFARLADVELIVFEPNGHLAILGREAAGEWRERHAD